MKKENILNCVVRLENNLPIIIMKEEKSSKYECFTFKDGHNEASLEYIRTLPIADEETTKKAINDYQNYLNSLPIDEVQLKTVKRLKLK